MPTEVVETMFPCANHGDTALLGDEQTGCAACDGFTSRPDQITCPSDAPHLGPHFINDTPRLAP